VQDTSSASPNAPFNTFTLAGVSVTAAFAFALTWLIHWTRGSGNYISGKGRITVSMVILGSLALLFYAYMRRQWLQYLRKESISETTDFVAKAQDFDHVIAAALTLVQEVELVSRGYRVYECPSNLGENC